LSDVIDPGTIKQKAIRSGKWAVIARFSQTFGGAVLFMILPYWLEPDQVGVITMFSSVLALGLLIQQAGFAEATIRMNENAEDIRDSAFWLNLAVSIVLYFLLFFLSPLICQFFYESRLILPLRIGGLQLILAGLSNVPMGWLQRTFRFRQFSLSHLLNSIVMIATALLLTNAGFGIWGYIIGILAGGIARVIFVFFALHWIPRLRFHWAQWLDILKFSGLVLMELILGWLLVWFDNIVVARHLGSRAAGIYSLAFSIATVTVSLPCSVITGLTLPVFSRLQLDMNALRSSYLRGTGLISAYAIPAAIGMCLMSTQIIKLIYPAQWNDLGSIISILALYSGFGYLWVLNTDAFKAIGKPEIMVKIYLISVIIMLPVYWWVSQIGLLEFTIARSLIIFVGALPHTYYAIRYLNLEKNYLWMVSRVPLIASIFMGVCVSSGSWFLRHFQLDQQINLFAVIGLVLTGITAYISALWFIAPDFVRQTYSLLLQSIRGRTA
jgi:O-antigen/teichoic acid export membrane protein